MIHDIYLVDIEKKERKHIDSLVDHTKMNLWLRNNGDINFVYEVWKNSKLISRWFFKSIRWGKMSTPKKRN